MNVDLRRKKGKYSFSADEVTYFIHCTDSVWVKSKGVKKHIKLKIVIGEITIEKESLERKRVEA